MFDRDGSTTRVTAAVEPNIGLGVDARQAVTTILNNRLADSVVLYQKTRNYHWNVRGPRFQPLHEFFETQYDQLEETIDEIAERVRQLGGNTCGTMTEYIQMSALKEHPGEIPSEQDMIANLLIDHEAVIRQLREDVDATAEDYHDQGTSDFLTGIMEGHEKMAWMLRAFLDG